MAIGKMPDWLEELLVQDEIAESKRRVELDKLRADQMLKAISDIEIKVEDVNKLADDEINIIEGYRQSELGKLDKKISWLAWNLEQFMRSTSEKTMTLPHGSLKLRLGRDKVEIVDATKFTQIARKMDLLRAVPASEEPDLQAIAKYIKRTGDIPTGVQITPAQQKFSYSTLTKGKDNGKQPAETGADERVSEGEIIEEHAI
jgi:phage host-nuclease inhibitor protein Gam